MFEARKVITQDGQRLALDVGVVARPKGVVVIAPALAVAKSFYQDYARFLNEQGFKTLAFDYRGSGQSTLSGPLCELKLEQWGRYDIDAVLSLALSDGLPVYYLGHSIGGQLLGLAPHSVKIEAALFISVSAPYWRRWPFPKKLQVWFASYAFIPLLARLTEHFPVALIGLGKHALPSRLFKQWAAWMRRPHYHLDPRFKLWQQHYRTIQCPIVSLGFSDDQMAPAKNLRYLLNFYPRAKSQLELVDASSIAKGTIGHVGFFRYRFRDTLWQSSVEHFVPAIK